MSQEDIPINFSCVKKLEFIYPEKWNGDRRFKITFMDDATITYAPLYESWVCVESFKTTSVHTQKGCELVDQFVGWLQGEEIGVI